MARRTELKPRTRGQIKWDKGKKSAALAVLDTSDYELPPSEMPAGMEFTIVHEVVHLELASLPQSEASRSSEEHAVIGSVKRSCGSMVRGSDPLRCSLENVHGGTHVPTAKYAIFDRSIPKSSVRKRGMDVRRRQVSFAGAGSSARRQHYEEYQCSRH